MARVSDSQSMEIENVKQKNLDYKTYKETMISTKENSIKGTDMLNAVQSLSQHDNSNSTVY